MAEKYICEILHLPGWIKPGEGDPRDKYGQHCMELMFVCRNGRGAVVLQLMTGWYPFAGVIGESSYYSARMAWHLPVPTDPTKIEGSVHDCNIIKQKCHGSSHYDHDQLWMKMLCYSTREHFWDAMKKFHAHMTQPGPWNPWDPKVDLVPNSLHLPLNTESRP